MTEKVWVSLVAHREEGLENVLRAVRENCWEIRLQLMAHNVDDEGALALANHIRADSRITRLDLSHNLISDLGATHLSEVLKESRLQLLDLSFNRIGEMGLLALTSQLAEAPALKCVRIGGNDVTPPIKAAVADLKRRHPRIGIELGEPVVSSFRR